MGGVGGGDGETGINLCEEQISSSVCVGGGGCKELPTPGGGGKNERRSSSQPRVLGWGQARGEHSSPLGRRGL